MDSQLKKGFLETCVLANLRNNDSYGYKIVQDLMPIIETSESTLYPVLRRLEEKKLLQTYTKEHNSRLRKYYRITPMGIEKLTEFKKDLVTINTIIDYIKMKGALNE